MILLVDHLESELSTERTVSGSRKQIGCIAPYLYIHNAPSGTFTFTVTGNGGSFSKTFTSAEVLSSFASVGNYAHVFFPIIPSAPTQLERGTYVLTLTASGYTYSNSSYIGWIRQHENPNDDFTPSNDDLENPLAVRLKVLTK